MADESLVFPGFYSIFPHVYLHRCPTCREEQVPILGVRDWQTFIASCPRCSFEAKFPPGSKSAARVRQWIAYERRALRRKPVDESSAPRFSRAGTGLRSEA
jgi:hypothetical protein